MRIEDFFNVCDRILRQAAEKNPEVPCLQNIPTEQKPAGANPQNEDTSR